MLAQWHYFTGNTPNTPLVHPNRRFRYYAQLNRSLLKSIWVCTRCVWLTMFSFHFLHVLLYDNLTPSWFTFVNVLVGNIYHSRSQTLWYEWDLYGCAEAIDGKELSLMWQISLELCSSCYDVSKCGWGKSSVLQYF